MVVAVSWVVFFGVLLAPTFSQAEDGLSGLGLLQRMSQASRQLTYSGTFVYRGSNHMETSSIAHALLDGREQERIEVLDGSPREVIRDGNEVKCFFPEDNRVIVENRIAQRRFPALLPAGLGNLQDHYLIRTGGNGRIAGMTSRSRVKRSSRLPLPRCRSAGHSTAMRFVPALPGRRKCPCSRSVPWRWAEMNSAGVFVPLFPVSTRFR